MHALQASEQTSREIFLPIKTMDPLSANAEIEMSIPSFVEEDTALAT